MTARVTQTRRNAAGYKVRTYVEVGASGAVHTWKTVEVPLTVLKRSATKSRIEAAQRVVERAARRKRVEQLLAAGHKASEVVKLTGMSSGGVYAVQAAMRDKAAIEAAPHQGVASVFDLGKSKQA